MRILGILFIAVLCALPQQGIAASRQAKDRAAKRACLTGDPAKGVAILTDLFIDTNEINYIFNQGRCFEQNRRYEDAIGRFREYLMKGKNLKDWEKTEAEKHIAACLSYLGKSEPREPVIPEVVKLATPPVEPVKQSQQVVVAGTPRTPPVMVTGQQEAQEADGKSGAGLRITGITVSSVGIAGIVTGVILNLKANSMARDLGKSENYSRSTDSTRKDYKTFAWISYGVGATCFASGAVLYYLGWRSSKNSAASIAMAPAISPNMVGTIVTGAF